MSIHDEDRLPWLRDLLQGPLLLILPEGPFEKQLRLGWTYIEAIVPKRRASEVRIPYWANSLSIFGLVPA